MPNELTVRRLRVEDAASLLVLRREALDTDPLAFAASVEDDRGLSPALVRGALADVREQAVFGAFDADALTGMVGLVRSDKVKQRHIGTVWGMFVAPRARSRGAGRALLDAAIRQARDWGLERVELGVSDSAVTARRMYEAAGFRAWGRQPRALQWQGRFVDEEHLVLDLRPSGDG
jgi:GNAT superfamily N-acetyltransferase